MPPDPHQLQHYAERPFTALCGAAAGYGNSSTLVVDDVNCIDCLHRMESMPHDPTPTPEPETIQPGIYRHFKGGEYEVIGVARDSGERMDFDSRIAVYRSLSDGKLWVRPAFLFSGMTITDTGEKVKRFTFIRSLAAPAVDPGEQLNPLADRALLIAQRDAAERERDRLRAENDHLRHSIDEYERERQIGPIL